MRNARIPLATSAAKGRAALAPAPVLQFLTVGQIADRHQTGREQVHRWIRKGMLAPILRVGRLIRVPREAVEDFEQRHLIGKAR